MITSTKMLLCMARNYYSCTQICILAESDCGYVLDLYGIFLRASNDTRTFFEHLLYARHLMY